MGSVMGNKTNPATTTGPQAAHRQECRSILAVRPDVCGSLMPMIAGSVGAVAFPNEAPVIEVRQPTPIGTPPDGRGGLIYQYARTR